MALSLRKLSTAARGKKPDSSTPSTAACKRHPKHHQSPGVCSLCLREKLSQISIGTATSSSSSSSSFSSGVNRYSSSSSSSSSSSLSPDCSSSSGSSMASPVHRYRLDGIDVIGKSRSRRRAAVVGNNGSSAGFWSKLMPGSRKDSR